jgi:hypothetical protein
MQFHLLALDLFVALGLIRAPTFYLLFIFGFSILHSSYLAWSTRPAKPGER